MKIIDIVILLLILVGAYAGYKKGLLVEILSFFAFIIAIITGFKLMHLELIIYQKTLRSPNQFFRTSPF